MNPTENPVMNDAEQRREELAKGLDNFSTPEAEEDTSEKSALIPKTEPEQVTPKNKKPGRFASLASNASPTPTSTAQPPQSQVPAPPPAPTPTQNTVPSQQTQVVSGRIVGAGANEPKWTKEQLQHFASLRAYRLEQVVANDSRKAIPDPEGRYVVKNSDGTCSATANAILPDLRLDQFKIGMGSPKADDKLAKKKMYSDIVIIGKDDNWVLNQWLSKDVIMEPVPASVRNRSITNRGKTSDRTIGVHFARFGFPVESFAPIFHTLDSSITGLIDSLVVTDGYYWANASWGVTQTPGTFVYMTEQGTRASTVQLTDAMDMIGTKSSKGVGTFAISIACGYEKQGDTIVPSSTKYEFSIKCHNFLHFEKSDFHGPPQTSAIGMMVGDDLMKQAQPLSKPKAVSTVMNSTGSLFGGANMNPFTSVNQQAGAKEGEKQGPGGNFLM